MNTANQPAAGASSTVDPDTRSQIRERLAWTPAQRLSYLKDMLASEQRLHGARRLS